MSRILSTTVTADGNTDIPWHATRKEVPNRATLYVFGTFGSGTVSLLASPDGGGTFIAVNDQIGVPVTFTVDGVENFELYANGNPISGETVQLRLALASSTTPSITYIIDQA